jgi:hypothetical protein
MPNISNPTEPLIGLQEKLDTAKLLLHEQLPGYAALALHELAREVLRHTLSGAKSAIRNRKSALGRKGAHV